MGFRGGNNSSGRIVILPGAFWVHGAFKMATLGASLLHCILQCFRTEEACFRVSHELCFRQAHCSCKGLCASSLCPRIHMRPLPQFGVSELTKQGSMVERQIQGIRDRRGTPKNLCDKDFAELSGELSGAIRLKPLVLLGNDR